MDQNINVGGSGRTVSDNEIAKYLRGQEQKTTFPSEVLGKVKEVIIKEKDERRIGLNNEPYTPYLLTIITDVGKVSTRDSYGGVRKYENEDGDSVFWVGTNSDAAKLKTIVDMATGKSNNILEIKNFLVDKEVILKTETREFKEKVSHKNVIQRLAKNQ